MNTRAELIESIKTSIEYVADNGYKAYPSQELAEAIADYVSKLSEERDELRKATEVSVTPEREYEARLNDILNKVEYYLNDDSLDADLAIEKALGVCKNVSKSIRIGWDDCVLTSTEYANLCYERDALKAEIDQKNTLLRELSEYFDHPGMLQTTPILKIKNAIQAALGKEEL